MNGVVGINDYLKSFLNGVEHVLNIKIYRDISIRLITLSRNTFLDKILKKFGMEQVKKEVLTCISRRSIELISVQEQWLNERKRITTSPMPQS